MRKGVAAVALVENHITARIEFRFHCRLLCGSLLSKSRKLVFGSPYLHKQRQSFIRQVTILFLRFSTCLLCSIQGLLDGVTLKLRLQPSILSSCQGTPNAGQLGFHLCSGTSHRFNLQPGHSLFGFQLRAMGSQLSLLQRGIQRLLIGEPRLDEQPKPLCVSQPEFKVMMLEGHVSDGSNCLRGNILRTC